MRGNFKTLYLILTIAAGVSPLPAAAIDRDALEARGEVYVAALYDGFQAEAAALARAGGDSAAAFLRGRAAAIEAGAEVFPFHPMGFTSLSASERRNLNAAYQETYALVGSEAADVAPEHIAAVQIAYEAWLIQAAGDDSEKSGLTWRRALERFIAWSGGREQPSMSSLAPPRAQQISARAW